MHFIQKFGLTLSVVLLIITTVLSLIPLPELPEVPGTDKTHHLIAYMSIALPVTLKNPKYLYYFLLGVVLWSGAIELIQPYVNRYGEWMDLLANSIGLVIGFVLGHLLKTIFYNLSKAK